MGLLQSAVALTPAILTRYDAEGRNPLDEQEGLLALHGPRRGTRSRCARA